MTSKFESTASGPAVSVIIPTLNEAEAVVACIEAARDGYSPEEVEIIVADGGSTDGTVDLVPPDVALICTERGRSTQMNQGAAVARGAVLLFCHADSRLPRGWREAVITALDRPGVSGGVFRTRILPEVTWILWLRNRLPMSSRWWEMHGDQAQFMTRATFERLGGFPHLPLIVIRLIGEPSIQLADQFFERYGNRAVLIARLIPGVSFDVISYAAGLSALKLGGFVVATGIGQLPATIAYSFLGATAASTASVGLWAVFGVVVLLVLSLVLRARLQKELGSNQQEADKEL